MECLACLAIVYMVCLRSGGARAVVYWDTLGIYHIPLCIVDHVWLTKGGLTKGQVGQVGARPGPGLTNSSTQERLG